jgi:hypothetical protein
VAQLLKFLGAWKKMKNKVINRIFCVLTIGLLTGCGGKNGGPISPSDPLPGHSVDRAPILKLGVQELVGHWTPSDSKYPEYDFYSSTTEVPFNTGLKTGRVFEKGSLAGIFYWEVQPSGSIELKMVSVNCFQRPLSQCPVLGSQTITLKGYYPSRSTWTIAFDRNADGVADSKASIVYNQAKIKSFLPSSQELYLVHDDNSVFDTPISGKMVNSLLSVRLDDFKKPITLTSLACRNGNQRITFLAGDSYSSEGTKDFFVSSMGDKTFLVKEWYENVVLLARGDKQFILEYELHRKVQIPSDIMIESVQLNDFEKVEKKSSIVSLVDTFSPGVSVQSLSHYFVSMELGFSTANAGNDLYFSSPTEGHLSVTPPHQETPAETHKFTWVQEDNGTIRLKFNDLGDVFLRFIKKIEGGYQVVYSVPSSDYGHTYRIRDFLLDGTADVQEQSLPGVYKFISIGALPNGSHEYNLTFHKDKSISGIVGGYWFQDVNGDIVSYECINLAGQKPTSYEECKGALSNLNQYAFVHLRRLHFVYKNGNSYQAKYTGSIYQYMPESANNSYYTFALTYRWEKVGDEIAH